MRLWLTTALAFIGIAAHAETPMSATAFETYSEGRTLYFGSDGEPYGAEQYLPGRRVIWTFFDRQCQMGQWYEDAGAICFIYENQPGNPQCWQFFRDGSGVSAKFENDPETSPIIEVSKNSEPLICPGPKVGV